MSTRRDYKPRAKKRAAPRRRRPTGLLAITGLMIGLFVAGLVYVNRHGSDTAVAKRPAPAKTAEPEVRAPSREPPAAGDSAEPRYDFYTLLPNRQVEIPSEELEPAREREAQARAEGPWVLQAGSFRQFSQADALRAQLALTGLESHINVTEGDSGTWHRVRLGPYASRREVDRIRSKLARADIRSIILRAEP